MCTVFFKSHICNIQKKKNETSGKLYLKKIAYRAQSNPFITTHMELTSNVKHVAWSKVFILSETQKGIYKRCCIIIWYYRLIFKKEEVKTKPFFSFWGILFKNLRERMISFWNFCNSWFIRIKCLSQNNLSPWLDIMNNLYRKPLIVVWVKPALDLGLIQYFLLPVNCLFSCKYIN